jgi:hypothetical protein
LRADRYLTLIANADKVLCDEEKDSYHWLSVLNRNIPDWTEGISDISTGLIRRVPFHVILHCEPDGREQLLQLVAAANVEATVEDAVPL